MRTDTASYLSEGPGLSVFIKSAGAVYLTYSTTARGLEPVMVYYGILDRVPAAVKRGNPRIQRGSAATTNSRSQPDPCPLLGARPSPNPRGGATFGKSRHSWSEMYNRCTSHSISRLEATKVI